MRSVGKSAALPRNPEGSELLRQLARGLAAARSLEDCAEQLATLGSRVAGGAAAWVLLPTGDDGEHWRSLAVHPARRRAIDLGFEDPLRVALRTSEEAVIAVGAAASPTGERAVAVRIAGGEHLAGALLLAAPEPPDPSRAAILESACALAALASDHARLADEARARQRQVDTLAAIARTISSTLELDRLFKLVTQQVRRLVPCDHASLAVLDAPGEAMAIAAVSGDAGGLAAGARYASTPALRGAVRYCPDLDLLRDCGDDPLLDLLRAAGLRAAVIVPVRVDGEVRGELCVAARAASAFTRAQCALLGDLAPHVGAALRNGELYQRLGASFQELSSARERLLRGERLRVLGEMASGVAHDFNNVLNAILHRAALLGTAQGAESGLTAAGRLGLERIEQAARRGAETVRRLQDFTRQRRDAAIGRVDLAAVLQEATRAAWGAAAQRPAPVRVELDAEPSLPSVRGEHGELVEVLRNLIDNALDAMPQGGRLRIEARSRASEQPAVAGLARQRSGAQIIVRDTGVGMDEPTRERAFDPFFTTKGVRGTGLGLSVVWGIVQRHGGEVTIESAPGRGTAVRVSLPGDGSRARPSPSQRPGRGAAPHPPRGTRVLLAEDDDINREATRALLEHAGCSVVETASGSEAIAAFRPSAFDLVLSDLGMPDRDGWEVARAVEEMAPATPMVLITGWGLTVDAEEACRRGVDLVIRKPVAPDELLRSLGALLAR